MLDFLIDSIFEEFGGRVFQQTISIPMGINCSHLLADLSLYSYEAEFIQRLLLNNKKKSVRSFNFIFRYIDDVWSLNNPTFSEHLDHKYPNELEMKETTDLKKSALYLLILREHLIPVPLFY